VKRTLENILEATGRTPEQLLECVRERCEVDVDGCWIWRGHRRYDGRPALKLGGLSPMSPSRLAYIVAGENRLGSKVLGLPNCDELCCNPAHQQIMTKARSMAIASAAGKLKATPTRRARMALASRARSGKLTAEQAREIRERRAAGEVLKAIAADYGVSKQLVHDIARGRYWRELRASPFAV
jgi:hypothetical protein